MKGNANILLKAKNVNERRLRYLPVQEKVQTYDDTLEIENYIYIMVSRLPYPVPLPKRHDFCSNVTILAATSRFWRQRH